VPSKIWGLQPPGTAFLHWTSASAKIVQQTCFTGSKRQFASRRMCKSALRWAEICGVSRSRRNGIPKPSQLLAFAFWNFHWTAGHYLGVKAHFDGVADGDLWLQASAHDGAAFAELFKRHSNSVYNHCFRCTGSWSLAEDLTSVVFLEAWRRRNQVKLYGDSILPWLLAVANNATRNSERSIRRHRRLLAKLPRTDTTSDFDSAVDERMEDEIRMRSILEALDLLKADEREVIALSDFSNLSYAEIATGLNIPIGTVRSRLSRAREHLRDLLNQGDVAQPLDPQLITHDNTKDAHDPS
jgi:RNA polymerase sigma factor (sigma-70 family)